MGARETPYDAGIAALEKASRPERTAPGAFGPYLDKVRRHAYRVTDADIEELKRAGYAEDEIFELTVSAAVAAGLERRAAALEVLP